MKTKERGKSSRENKLKIGLLSRYPKWKGYYLEYNGKESYLFVVLKIFFYGINEMYLFLYYSISVISIVVLLIC